MKVYNGLTKEKYSRLRFGNMVLDNRMYGVERMYIDYFINNRTVIMIRFK